MSQSVTHLFTAVNHCLSALVSMADNGKTIRKIRQGKVDIDYEESTLVIHYDLELVRN